MIFQRCSLIIVLLAFWQHHAVVGQPGVAKPKAKPKGGKAAAKSAAKVKPEAKAKPKAKAKGKNPETKNKPEAKPKAKPNAKQNAKPDARAKPTAEGKAKANAKAKPKPVRVVPEDINAMLQDLFSAKVQSIDGKGATKLYRTPFHKKIETALKSGELMDMLRQSEADFPLPTDKVGLICFDVAFFIEFYMDAFSQTSDAKVKAFVESCRAVWKTIDPEVRSRVEKLHDRGELRSSLSKRFDLEEGPDECRVDLPVKSDREMLFEFGQEILEWYKEADARPLKEQLVEPSEVGRAWEHAEVVKFDATKLLPRRVFNLTWQRLRNWHRTDAKNIPLFRGPYFGKSPYCQTFFQQTLQNYPKWGPNHKNVSVAIRAIAPWMLQNECVAPSISLDEFANLSLRFTTEEYGWNILEKQGKLIRGLAGIRPSESVKVHNLNTRRLKIFHDVDYGQALGLGDAVQHAHAFLWTGITPGLMHIDAYDNILIQITGTVHLFAFSSNCSVTIRNNYDHDYETAGIGDWIRKKAARIDNKVYIYHMKIKPGDGVVIPANAYHHIVNGDSRRIALNVFFEPKFKEMRWESARRTPWFRLNEDVLAVRNLWVQAVGHLFDSKRVGFAHQLNRLELI